MNQEPDDLYSLLGVDRGATPEAIAAAFAAWNGRAAAGEAIDDETWQRIRYAFDVLSSPARRAVYDSLVSETAGASLLLDVTLSADRLPISAGPQLLYVLLTIRPQSAAAERRPLNVGLVVDRSTSMRGERLARVTEAVELLLDKLGRDDTLSLVSFSDRAEVVLPAAPIGKAARSPNPETAAAWRDPRRRLRAITASGGTEIYQGLRAGLEQVARVATEGHTSHLILLTDGHTYGDAADCLRLAADAAVRGIGITAFGLGADWNDAFLDALVAPSGGQSHYVEQPADVLPHLEGRLEGLGAIYARGLSLRRTWPGQLSPRAGFKLAPFPQPLTLDAGPIPLGDLEGRSAVSVLLEFLVEPQPVAARFRLPLEVRYTAADGTQETAGRGVQLLTQPAASDGPPPATALLEAARLLGLYRMQEKAWEEAQSGLLDTAATRMRRLTTRYMETGDLRLAQQAQLEAQRMAHAGAMTAEGRKLLKYGTRSLMRPAE
jgi:Ca-activated chloride channel family protein